MSVGRNLNLIRHILEKGSNIVLPGDVTHRHVQRGCFTGSPLPELMSAEWQADGRPTRKGILFPSAGHSTVVHTLEI